MAPIADSVPHKREKWEYANIAAYQRKYLGFARSLPTLNTWSTAFNTRVNIWEPLYNKQSGSHIIKKKHAIWTGGPRGSRARAIIADFWKQSHAQDTPLQHPWRQIPPRTISGMGLSACPRPRTGAQAVPQPQARLNARVRIGPTAGCSGGTTTISLQNYGNTPNTTLL